MSHSVGEGFHAVAFFTEHNFRSVVHVFFLFCFHVQESEFFDLLQLYFPKLYDIKFLASSQDGFHGGLNKLAEDLKVRVIVSRA